MNGSNNAEGRVEVLYDGSWETVCDVNWYLREARVACRMLGFDGALEAPRSARFGQGSGNILGVGCYGTEDSLIDCPSVWVVLCRHNKDAGAVCYSGDHPNPFQVRLIGGSNDAEGRVEVLHGGSWGTVCDRNWDLRDARVVCKMLKFDGALNASRSARFGQGSGNILLDLVGCEGTEDNLAECGHLGVGVNYCGHDKDAGALCYSGAHPNPLQVRLVGGSNDAEGRVEVRHDGSWGTVCHWDWDLRDARVVCRMLGYAGALQAPGSARFGQGSGSVFLKYVNCNGTEDNLADCAHAGIERYWCSHGEDAGAVCYLGAHPNPLQIRLIGGSNDAEGRVEVMHDGSWGTVCDVWWDLRDAIVVCRMLGYAGALHAPGSATFGQGSGRALLKYVNCNGTEDNLADCAHAGIQRYWCSHADDAGAICYSEELTTVDEFETTDQLFSSTAIDALSAKLGKASFHLNTTDTYVHLNPYGPGTLQSKKINLNLIILLAISISVTSIALIAAFVYCLCRGRMKSAQEDLDSTVYMDLMHSRSAHNQTLDSIYQDLSSPPKLPDRWSAVVSSRDNKLQDTMSLNTTRQQVHGMDTNEQNASHEYMDMNTVHQMSPFVIGHNCDGYLRSTVTSTQPEFYVEIDKTATDDPVLYKDTKMRETRHNINYLSNEKDRIRQYMKPVNEKPPTDVDVNVDGYLLSTTTVSESEYSKVIETTCADVSDFNKKTEIMRHGPEQDAGHKYMDMKPIYKKSSTTTDADLNGYLLPSARASNMSKSKFTAMTGTTAADGTDANNDAETTKQINILDPFHKYLDMNINQKPPVDTDVDLDGYKKASVTKERKYTQRDKTRGNLDIKTHCYTSTGKAIDIDELENPGPREKFVYVTDVNPDGNHSPIFSFKARVPHKATMVQTAPSVGDEKPQPLQDNQYDFIPADTNSDNIYQEPL